MSRPLSSGLQAAIAAEKSGGVHLLQLEHSGGVLRLTDAPVDVSAMGQTWTGIGGVFQLGEVSESTDTRGQGLGLTLGGVDTTVISMVLSYHVRGQEAVMWVAHLDDGDIVADPYEMFRGYLNEAWKIRGGGGSGTVTVTTRAVSRLAVLGQRRSVRTNLASHREMLVRAGFTGGDLGDTFFSRVGALVNRTVWWGTDKDGASVGGMGTRGTEEDTTRGKRSGGDN